MPYAKKRTPLRRKRVTRKYRRPSYRRPSAGLRNSIIGNKQLAVHRISTLTTLNPTAGALDLDPYNANFSLNDPTGVIGTEQPNGFDQLSALYEDYTVIGSRIKVTFIANPGATVTPRVGIVMYTSTAPTTINDLKEHRNSVIKTMRVGDQTASTVCYLAYSPKKEHGRKIELGNNVSGGDVKGMYYGVFAYPADEAGDVSAISADVKIEYLVVWHHPKMVTSSD